MLVGRRGRGRDRAADRPWDACDGPRARAAGRVAGRGGPDPRHEVRNGRDRPRAAWRLGDRVALRGAGIVGVPLADAAKVRPVPEELYGVAEVFFDS